MAPSPLAGFGWCFLTPSTPTPNCRWCGKRHEPTVGGGVVCPHCDMIGTP